MFWNGWRCNANERNTMRTVKTRRRKKKEEEEDEQEKKKKKRFETLARLITGPCAASSRCAPELLSSGQQGFHAADSHRHQLHIDYMLRLYLKEEASASQASLYFYFYFCGNRSSQKETADWLRLVT